MCSEIVGFFLYSWLHFAALWNVVKIYHVVPSLSCFDELYLNIIYLPAHLCLKLYE